MKRSAAEILGEYGPFPGAEHVAGVTYDGQNVWFASGDKLNAFDPKSGEKVRAIDVAAHAGTAFDGHHLFQLSGDCIQKLIRTPAACSAQFLRPGEPVRDSRGAKARSGWGNIGTGRSIKSIPTQARFFAPSNPTALSRASHGSMGSSGMPLWKGTRAICGASILKPGRCWRQSKCHRG